MIREILHAFGHGIVRYYLALRMNAGASTPAVFFADQLERPVPIVRTVPTALDGQWDAREIVGSGLTTGVLTQPINQVETNGSNHIGMN